jgi:hypothetical protein
MGQSGFRIALAALAVVSCLAACTPQPDAAGPAVADDGANLSRLHHLVGATPAVLTAELGAPALRRSEGPDEVWLYRSPVCGLAVFLFPNADGTERVAAAQPASGNVGPGSCMASLEHAAAS